MTGRSCPVPKALASYVAAAGDADPAASARATALVGGISRARIEAHAAGCAQCRGALAVLGVLALPETVDEAAAIERLIGTQGGVPQLLGVAAHRAGPGALVLRAEPGPVARVLPFRKIIAIAAPVLAAAAALLIVGSRPGAPDLALAPLENEGRPLEAALSQLPYAPFRPHRGAERESAFDKPLRQLLVAQEEKRPGAERALAMLFLLRGGAGDAERSEALLARAGSDADSENDRGVALYVRGDAEAALESFDRALFAQPAHRAARFNRALALQRLELVDTAAAAFAALAAEDPQSPFSPEARAREQALNARGSSPQAPPLWNRRRGSFVALLSASTPEALRQASRELAAQPANLTQDLLRLARAQDKLTPAELGRHAALWDRYRALRASVLAGTAPAGASGQLASESAADPLLAPLSLQLAAYAKTVKGEVREGERLQFQVLRFCEARPCAVETQAIALDELAESAGRAGDYAAAHRQQDRAEALFAGVDARTQLAELHRKRAALLLHEQRFFEAAQSAALALRELSDDAVAGPNPATTRASALEAAGSVAVARGHLRAAAELYQGALALAQSSGELEDLAVQLVGALALDEERLGQLKDARAVLDRALGKADQGGERTMQAQLRLALAQLAGRRGDSAERLDQSAQGLVLARAGSWSPTVSELHVEHALALSAVGRTPEAAVELTLAVAEAAKSARSSPDPAAAVRIAEGGRDAAIEAGLELARQGRPAEETLLPIDALRAAALGAVPAAAGWSRELPVGACVVGLLAGEDALLAATLSRDGGDVRVIKVSRSQLEREVAAAQEERTPGSATDALAQQIFAGLDARCRAGGEVWFFAEPPFGRIDLTALPWHGERLGRRSATGIATSLRRLLAPEPALGTVRDALLVDSVQASADAAGAAPDLPAAQREKAALLHALPSAQLVELTGARATPEAFLQALPRASLVHIAAHGQDEGAAGANAGGYLQLAGDGGRLTARDFAAAHLREGTRVVLSSCESATPGSGGLAFALARAGATASAAAEGQVDDAAAGAWSEAFYAALVRGASFAQANHEALRSQPDSATGAWFIVTK